MRDWRVAAAAVCVLAAASAEASDAPTAMRDLLSNKREVISMRSANTKVYETEEGIYLAEIWPGQIHRIDAEGKWVDSNEVLWSPKMAVDTLHTQLFYVNGSCVYKDGSTYDWYSSDRRIGRYTGEYPRVYRSVFAFLTTGLPDDAFVGAALLGLYQDEGPLSMTYVRSLSGISGVAQSMYNLIGSGNLEASARTGSGDLAWFELTSATKAPIEAGALYLGVQADEGYSQQKSWGQWGPYSQYACLYVAFYLPDGKPVAGPGVDASWALVKAAAQRAD